jgi:hypothetical protein
LALTSDAISAARMRTCIHTSLRGVKRRSNPFFLRGEMDCFASLAMTIKPLSRMMTAGDMVAPASG